MSSPQAKQLCGSNSKPRRRAVGARSSDVKVADLARWVWMKSLRGRDLLAHQHVKISSASTASSISTRSSVRVSGFIVVSQSCSAFISPRPL